MTDRELLELAAKAAGMTIKSDPNGVIRNCTGMHQAMNVFAAEPWNPLEDDGDALRLAVKLGICLGPNFDGDRAIADGGKFSQHHVVEMFGGDKDAATRRAIVRCAAEIGKETK